MTATVWTEQMIAKAEVMWRGKATVTVIGEALGVKRQTVCKLLMRERARFPMRTAPRNMNGRRGRLATRKEDGIIVIPNRAYIDRVSRITFAGAMVTLPRVAFIDGASS